jgi:hypothetical protein
MVFSHLQLVFFSRPIVSCTECPVINLRMSSSTTVCLYSRTATFYVWVSVHQNSVLYKEPTRCNFSSIVISHCKITRFGRFLRPSSGVLKSVVAATGACYGSGWYMSSNDVRGRLPTAYCAVGNRPRTSLLDIYHSDPWHAPVAATTVSSTPDDGRRKRP